MILYENDVRKISMRLLRSRVRLICDEPFIGLIFFHMKIILSQESDYIWVEMPDKLMINPKYIMTINDAELDCLIIAVLSDFVEDILDDGQSMKEPNDQGNDDSDNQNGQNGDEEEYEDGQDDSDKSEKDNYSSKKSGGKKGISDKTEEKGTESDEQNNSDCKENGDEESNNIDVYLLKDIWKSRISQAHEVAKGRGCGYIPGGVNRYIDELKNPKLDWRTILDEFIQEEVVDYSFSPPDRRFGDSPFFLPDYNDKDTILKNILFMIDTSGSMSKNDITEAYSEIYGAIEQYNGKVEGLLGFFDAGVTEPKPFTEVGELLEIIPRGGGGTDFEEIFNYISKEMGDIELASIIILTDGYCSFPDEEKAMEIPVLWVINNSDVNPPWGKVARIG